MYWYNKSEIFNVKPIIAQYHELKELRICQSKKKIIYALWEAGKTQNKVDVQIGCSQSAISKIKKTCSKQSNCGSKPKTTAIDEGQLNRFLISHWFANCGKISKA